MDRVDQARAAADRWSTELKRLWAAETRAAVTPHEAAAQARSDAHAALRQAITDFHAATRVRVAESDLTPARLDSTLEELQGKTVLANGPGSATAFEDLRRAAEHSHRADALAHWVEDNIPHPHAPASTPPPPGHEGEDPIGGTPAKPTDPTQPNSDPSAHPVPVPESHPKSDPNDPDTWFDRMQAEQADWSAQMEAKRAQWLHDIADRMEPGSTEERFARLRAENADRLARIAADRADWFWDQAGGRPDTPEPDAPTPGPDGPDSGGGPRPDAGFNDGAAQPKPDPDPGTAEGGRAPVARHESQPPTGPTEAEHVAGAEAHPAEPAPEPPRGEAGEPVGGKTPAVGQPESPSNDGGTESGQGGAGDPGAPRSEQKAVDDENASGGRGSPPKAAEDTGYGPTPSGENEATATGATSAGKAAANGEETRADGAGAHAGGDEAGCTGQGGERGLVEWAGCARFGAVGAGLAACAVASAQGAAAVRSAVPAVHAAALAAGSAVGIAAGCESAAARAAESAPTAESACAAISTAAAIFAGHTGRAGWSRCAVLPGRARRGRWGDTGSAATARDSAVAGGSAAPGHAAGRCVPGRAHPAGRLAERPAAAVGFVARRTGTTGRLAAVARWLPAMGRWPATVGQRDSAVGERLAAVARRDSAAARRFAAVARRFAAVD